MLLIFFFFGGGGVIGEGHLLQRGAYFENLTFWRGAYWRGGLLESERLLDHLR